MAKILRTIPTPLDRAVEDFLNRIAEEGKTLNYVAGYTLERAVDDPYTVVVKFYADEALAQFGASNEATQQ